MLLLSSQIKVFMFVSYFTFLFVALQLITQLHKDRTVISVSDSNSFDEVCIIV